MKNEPTSMVTASLLFAGVMLLASCATVSKSPQPGTPLEEIQTELTTLDQRIAALESLETRVTTLEKTVKTKIYNEESTLNQEPQPVYTNPVLLYNRARSLLLEENFQGAAGLFKEYVKQFPDSELADNALYWLGECHYSQGEYQTAIKIFKDVVTLYPKREKVPDALLKTAYSYLILDDSDRAHHYLKLVVKGYPFTQAGEKAEQKLKAFQ
ncbi:MAG: tol-pal system protein YbgF [Desulfobacterium sp.]|jgi:tol-pal system protein YbgF|nr:tol-pal system protein YbgF [Desulfobacterium sp.]MDY0376151.1 tol-pal system protein YbgF [Desulfobacterium sp.]